MAVFPAVLDASVLFNRPVTDTLLRAAEYGLYRVHWSKNILDETTRNLIEKRKITNTQAAHLQRELAKAFPEALVSVPDNLIEQMTNSKSDRHVVAAAVMAHAQVIVTFNLKHFKMPSHLSHFAKNIQASTTARRPSGPIGRDHADPCACIFQHAP